MDEEKKDPAVAADGGHPKKKKKKKKKKKTKAEKEAEEAALRAAEEAERQRLLEEQRAKEVAIKKAKAVALEKADRERQKAEDYTPVALWKSYEDTREAMHEATMSDVPAHSPEMDALRRRLAEERKGLDWLHKGHKHKVKGEPHFVLAGWEERLRLHYSDPMPGTWAGPKVPGTLVDDEKALVQLYRSTGGPHPDSDERIEPPAKAKPARRLRGGGGSFDGSVDGSMDGSLDEDEQEVGVCYRENCVKFREECAADGAKYPSPRLRLRWRRRRNWRHVGRWMELCEAYVPPTTENVQPPYPKGKQPEPPTIEEIVKAAVPKCEGLVIHKARVINVSLFANSLRGPLASLNLSFLTMLKVLNLHGNRLTGPIPEGLVKCSLLTHIDLSRNELTGPLPKGLENLKYLKGLHFELNHLEGPLPPSFASLLRLEELTGYRNHINGGLPPDIGECRELQVLSLHTNRLAGFLPESITQCTKLRLVHLSKNKFRGSVPPSLAEACVELPSTPRTGTTIAMQIFPSRTDDSDSEAEDLEREREEAEAAAEAARLAEEAEAAGEANAGAEGALVVQEAGGYYDEYGNWVEGYYDDYGNWVYTGDAAQWAYGQGYDQQGRDY